MDLILRRLWKDIAPHLQRIGYNSGKIELLGNNLDEERYTHDTVMEGKMCISMHVEGLVYACLYV